MSEWISVEDRLPKDDENVLFINSNLGGVPQTAWYEEGVGFFPYAVSVAANLVAVVTHWMPLPEKPKP